jgi:hypothetical protein
MAVKLADLLRDPGARLRIAQVTDTPGDGTITVLLDGSELTIPHALNYSPGVNDSAIVLADGMRRVAIGAYTNPSSPVAPASPAVTPSQPPPKPVPKPPTTVTATKTFTAKGTGCFRNGKWRTDTKQPHQGDWNGAFGRNTGAWFYGTGIRSALSGATVLSAQIYMKRLTGGSFGSVSPTIYGTPHASQPSGSPTLQGGGTDLTGQPVSTARWVTLPTSLAQDLVDGVSFGIACFVAADAPYAVYASLADSRQSGAIKITYRKAV